MKIYERYFSRQLFSAIALIFAVLLALYGFFDVIESLKDVGRGDFGVPHAFLYVALRLPGRLYELMPIAILIGALYALSTLARHSEITVLRASGLSTGAILKLLFKIASVFAIAALILGETLVPFTERIAEEMRTRAIHLVSAQTLQSGIWMKDGTSFVHLDAATPDARISGLRVYQFDENKHLSYVMEAQSGTYDVAADAWTLKNVSRTVLGEKDGKATGWVEKEPQSLWKSAMTPQLLSVLMVAPERMSIYSLARYLKHLWSNNLKAERYEIALWKKFFYPFSALVMIALALPFGTTFARSGGASLAIFSGVMVGVLFHMLNGLFSSLGVLHTWPSFLSAALPSLLFLLAAFGFLRWTEKR
ncbi:MAG: LPS export ABC transporter permease LptG [Zoogloeaceae bacterium]|jgi:lipopolysaccharide export system permease protein|nr:LPS export ABC transporter permease LptG [Zoogloeaceae bacterium]